MRIYVDIDGTVTQRQRGRSWFRDGHRLDVIGKLQELQHDNELILWSGSTSYAQEVAKELESLYGVHTIAAVGKPNLLIDNERDRWSKRIAKRMITPEEFLAT